MLARSRGFFCCFFTVTIGNQQHNTALFFGQFLYNVDRILTGFFI